jgi:hypothetical protein
MDTESTCHCQPEAFRDGFVTLCRNPPEIKPPGRMPSAGDGPAGQVKPAGDTEHPVPLQIS